MKKKKYDLLGREYFLDNLHHQKSFQVKGKSLKHEKENDMSRGNMTSLKKVLKKMHTYMV